MVGQRTVIGNRKKKATGLGKRINEKIYKTMHSSKKSFKETNKKTDRLRVKQDKTLTCSHLKRRLIYFRLAMSQVAIPGSNWGREWCASITLVC